MLDYGLFGFGVVAVLVFILEKSKDGRIDCYRHLAPGIGGVYLCLALGVYWFRRNLVVEAVAWMLVIWTLLIKIDNVDQNSYNFTKLTYLLISLAGGTSIWISEYAQNNFLQLIFWIVFLLGYLIGYKIMMRIWCHKKRF